MFQHTTPCTYHWRSWGIKNKINCTPSYLVFYLLKFLNLKMILIISYVIIIVKTKCINEKLNYYKMSTKEKDIKEKLYGKRRYYKMEKNYEEEKDSIFNKSRNINKLNNYNISTVKIMKRILKIKINDIDEVMVNLCSSTMTNQDYE